MKKRKPLAISFRFLAYLRWRILRLLTVAVNHIWIGKIYGRHNIPTEGPAIVISNHTSYMDFLILGAILPKDAVFLAVNDLRNRPGISFFTKLNRVIYVNRDNPGFRFFRDLLWQLKRQKRIVIIYPEGTRSRTGNMSKPKVGFLRVALKSRVPIYSIALRNAFAVLPPQARIPKLKKCDIFFLPPVYIKKEAHAYVFYSAGQSSPEKILKISDCNTLEDAAVQIMNRIRRFSKQKWDSPPEVSVVARASSATDSHI